MIKIIVLLENTTKSTKVKCKHGLSLYVETKSHKILFDMSPNDLFLKNSKSLGIDISAIDIAIISHGHIDHCGGLKYFLENNKKAKIYLRLQAVEKHYVKLLKIPFNIGINNALVSGDRFIFTNDIHKIDDEILLFSNSKGKFLSPKSNDNLFTKRNGKIIQDDFCHEQNLLITSKENQILFCGCAHSGIVNIISQAKNITGKEPTAVIGGFHLYEPIKKRYESDKYIDNVAIALAKEKSSYYTCHCTGKKAYEKMKKCLGTRLTYLQTGAEIKFKEEI